MNVAQEHAVMVVIIDLVHINVELLMVCVMWLSIVQAQVQTALVILTDQAHMFVMLNIKQIMAAIGALIVVMMLV